MVKKKYENPIFEILDLFQEDMICKSVCVIDGDPVICETDACATPYDNM